MITLSFALATAKLSDTVGISWESPEPTVKFEGGQKDVVSLPKTC